MRFGCACSLGGGRLGDGEQSGASVAGAERPLPGAVPVGGLGGLCVADSPFLLGESVDDCGGGYSESIAEICEELQNGLTPLLIVTPNGRDESGANRDCYLLNPATRAPVHCSMFRFLGGPLGRLHTLCPSLKLMQGLLFISGSRGGRDVQ